MARYVIQFPGETDVQGIASYLRETAPAGSFGQDRTIIEFDQAAHDALAALTSDADGHIDDSGDMWIGGTDYAVGRL